MTFFILISLVEIEILDDEICFLIILDKGI